jgi:hypothetical protein
MDPTTARDRINPAQGELIDRLEGVLEGRPIAELDDDTLAAPDRE